MFATIMASIEPDDRAFMLDFYQAYYGLVHCTIQRLVDDAHLLEDLVSEVFLKLIEKTALIRRLDCCGLGAYVVSTSRGVAINYLKRREVQNKHMSWVEDIDTISETLTAVASVVEQSIIDCEEEAALVAAIRRLPELLRSVLCFKYLLEMDDREIADLLLIKPGSVRQYLTRARRAAKELLEEARMNDG